MVRRFVTRFLLNNVEPTLETPERDLHLVCGAGGTRAIIGCAGAVFGMHAMGMNSWASIGGISGGSLPTLLYAAGIHPRALMRRALTTDFSTLVVKRRHLLQVLRKFMGQAKHERLPRTAVHCSKGMVKFIDDLVPTWPDKFWTMATTDLPKKGRCQVLFTKRGVFLYDKHGNCEQLSYHPAPVGLAIAASCAIPGVIDHVEYLGMQLYDGMMSWDGRTPARLVKLHYGAAYEDIVAVDVGGIKPPFPSLTKRIAAYLCDDDCHPDTHMTPDQWDALGVRVVRANIHNFGSLNLNPTLKQRSHAMRLGYTAAVRTLCPKRGKFKFDAKKLLASSLEQFGIERGGKTKSFAATQAEHEPKKTSKAKAPRRKAKQKASKKIKIS